MFHSTLAKDCFVVNVPGTSAEVTADRGGDSGHSGWGERQRMDKR